MLSRVSSGVALGVSEIRTLRLGRRTCTSSKMSGRFSGSPPVSTKTGTSMTAISSIRRLASAVVSSMRVAQGLGTGAAVYAGQIAGLGGLPDGHERPFVEVRMLVHAPSSRFGQFCTTTIADASEAGM